MRELEVGIDGNVLNNIVIVLCDLCVRYTALVDKYVPTICTCLKDPNPFVRKQALLLLTGLLQVCGRAAPPAGPGAGVGRRGVGSEQRNKCVTSFSLQEDFVRWKGCLFFRFIITVVDPNPEVAR